MKRNYKMILCAIGGYIIGDAVIQFTPFWVGLVIAVALIVIVIITPDE
jgi:hypothetical protein